MKHLVLPALILLVSIGCVPQKKEPKAFSFHLFQEPLHLDPARLRGSSASYFFYNMLRGIYRYDEEKGLLPEGGECQWITKLELKCQLFNRHWSNGDKVLASEYLKSFQHLVDPQTASPRAAILENIENATEILDGKKPRSSLGVKALSKNELRFRFTKKDPEFLYKLASTALYPTHRDHQTNKTHFKKFLSNGPYVVDTWSFGVEMTLKPNPYYKTGHPKRPLVRIYFIDDEMTAFRLYENNKLSFHRRTPSKLYEQLKDREDFIQITMARFDYIGFGKEVFNNPKLREALSLSIDYEALAKLLHALGRPGCPSLPHSWFTKAPCHNFDLKKSKEIVSALPDSLKNKTFQLKVSALGGNDIKKQAEFLQSQWKNNLGLNIEIQQVEQKVFLSELRQSPPDIFRKGVGLDRPTCLNGLETFTADNLNNYMNWEDKAYRKILEKMAITFDKKKYKTLCTQAMNYLIENHVMIPLGEMHFSLLARPNYVGWSLNSMNQLDLSQLHPISK